MAEVVIVAGARTPQGKLLGALASLSAVELGAHAIAHALERAGISTVDGVIMGQVLQAGCGQNPARQAALAAGLGMDVPAETVNKVCLSGLSAIITAARTIALGDAEVMVAGGMESMSGAPHALRESRRGKLYGEAALVDTMECDGLTDTASGESMGVLTDAGNAERDLRRENQDEVAERSHSRAAAAREAGLFEREIAPVTIPQRRGGDVVMRVDEGIRDNTSVEGLAKLRPAFTTDGTLTAGNSSPISDGAAAVVVASAQWAREHGLKPLARIVAYGQTAGPDTSLHTKPADAIDVALKRAGWKAAELDLVEINEAFASVVVASAEQLGIDEAVVNPHGGAIALGHPIGASGARLALHAAVCISEGKAQKAAVALCGGGGQGDALLLAPC